MVLKQDSCWTKEVGADHYSPTEGSTVICQGVPDLLGPWPSLGIQLSLPVAAGPLIGIWLPGSAVWVCSTGRPCAAPALGTRLGQGPQPIGETS